MMMSNTFFEDLTTMFFILDKIADGMILIGIIFIAIGIMLFIMSIIKSKAAK